MKVLNDIILGLMFLHGNKVAHRDLKPENILIAADGNCKVCDFGISMWISTEDLKSSISGTRDYLAPELTTNSSFNEKIDIWSVGVICFELLNGFTYKYMIDDIIKGSGGNIKTLTFFKQSLSNELTHFR